MNISGLTSGTVSFGGSETMKYLRFIISSKLLSCWVTSQSTLDKYLFTDNLRTLFSLGTTRDMNLNVAEDQKYLYIPYRSLQSHLNNPDERVYSRKLSDYVDLLTLIANIGKCEVLMFTVHLRDRGRNYETKHIIFDDYLMSRNLTMTVTSINPSSQT